MPTPKSSKLSAGQKALLNVKAYPLSDDDIRHILPGIHIVNYPDLKGLRTAEELFDDRGRCILLFPNSGPQSGHWTCLIRHPDHIEFFDPYGDRPDTAQKRGIPEAEKEEWGIEDSDLTRLLRASGAPVFYNTRAFQTSSPSVADCGRHCCCRLLYAPKSLDEYADVIRMSKLSPDDFVCGLTASKLGR